MSLLVRVQMVSWRQVSSFQEAVIALSFCLGLISCTHSCCGRMLGNELRPLAALCSPFSFIHFLPWREGGREGGEGGGGEGGGREGER